MSVKLKAGSIEVLRRMENGAAIVRVPVAPTQVVDLDRTESTMQGKMQFGGEMFAQMVENFDKRGRPVTVGFDKVNAEGHDRDVDGPQMAFVQSIEVDGTDLMFVIRLGPSAASMVVDNGAFEGFSIEAEKDLVTPTGTIDGWVAMGGIFTNRPATESMFRIAASEKSSGCVTILESISADPEGPDNRRSIMTDKAQEDKVTLAFHETALSEKAEALTAKTAEADAASASLTAAKTENVSLTAKVAELTTELDTVKSEKIGLTVTANQSKNALAAATKTIGEQAATINEINAKLTEAENANIGEKVTATIQAAIDKGVKPAAFGDWEGDPAAWLAANYTNIDAFERQTANLCGAIGATSVVTPKSGHDPKTDGPKEHQVSDEQRKINERLGIGAVNYAGAKTAKEAKARALAAKAKE